jgi:hypothetical protein
MARLLPLAQLRREPFGPGFATFSLVALVALGGGACDDYNEPPPATAANAAGDPNAPGGQNAGQNAPDSDSYTDTDPSALTDFHSTLDPHGQWVEDPTHGTVWVPNGAEVGADFSPYETSGHWAYDDDDYVWVSDYEWGWAPFHYGRWVLTPTGWAWIPGRVYAGAWVDWSMGYPGWAYVGWAPMYPAFIWRAGYPVGYVAIGQPGHFYYCGQGEVFAGNIGAHVVAGPQAASIGAHMSAYGGAGATATAGGGRVAATPGVVGAAPMHGPPPSSMGIAPANVTHVAAGDRGMAMAKGFAKPSTATKMGAHPPANHSFKSAPKGKAGGVHGGGVHGGGGFHGGHR